MDGNVNDNYIVSSVVRGFKILSTFTVNRPALKVTEIAYITGLDQATVFRFVYTMEKLGYLVRDEETKRYRQSIRLRTLSLPAMHGIVVRDAAIPTIEFLTKQVNEAIKLAVLDGVDIIILGFTEVIGKLDHHTHIGTRLPAYCTALGKAILAFQPADVMDALVSKIEFLPRTGRTITSPDLFKEELLKIRPRGYATEDGELIAGLGALAAPIFDQNRDVVASISISGIASQVLHGDGTDNYVSELLVNSEMISSKMGYVKGIT